MRADDKGKEGVYYNGRPTAGAAAAGRKDPETNKRRELFGWEPRAKRPEGWPQWSGGLGDGSVGVCPYYDYRYECEWMRVQAQQPPGHHWQLPSLPLRYDYGC